MQMKTLIKKNIEGLLTLYINIINFKLNNQKNYDLNSYFFLFFYFFISLFLLLLFIYYCYSLFPLSLKILLICMYVFDYLKFNKSNNIMACLKHTGSK